MHLSKEDWILIKNLILKSYSAEKLLDLKKFPTKGWKKTILKPNGRWLFAAN